MFTTKGYILFVVTLGIFLDTFSYSIVIPFFPNVISEIGGDAKDVGITLSFFSAGLLIGSFVFGFISDRIEKRKGMMVSGLGMLIGASLVMAFWKSMWALVIGRFLQGLSSGVIWVLGLALIADTHSPEEMGVKMGLVFSAYSVGNFVGPIVGGPLYQHVGYQAPFLLIAILAVIDGIARLLLFEKENDSQPESIFTSLQLLFRNAPLMLIFLLTASSGIFIGSLEVGITLFLEKRYVFQPDQVGYAFLTIAIPELVFGPIAGWFYDKYGFKKVIIPGLIATSACLGLMAINLPLAGFLAILGLAAASLMFGFAPVLPEIVHCVPESLYGASYGLFNCAFAVGLLIGPIVAGLLYQYTGWEGYICFISIFLFTNTIVPLIYKPPSKEASDNPMVIDMQSSQDTLP